MTTLESDRFLIPHIPHCAGTTRAVVAPPEYERITIVTGHMRVEDWARLLKKHPCDKEAVIAVIRCPYDREYSHWRYERILWRDRFVPGAVCEPRIEWAARHETVSEYVFDPQCKFPTYYEQTWYDALYPPAPYDPWEYIRSHSYYPYWLKIHESLPCNLRVVRVERLAEELKEATGHEWNVENRYNACGFAGSKAGEFTDEAKEHVRSIYPWAFEHFYNEDGSLK